MSRNARSHRAEALRCPHPRQRQPHAWGPAMAPHEAEARRADQLRPLPWLPGQEPAVLPPSESTAPPLLLLLDRRQPIGAELRQRLAASLNARERQRLHAYRLAADQERFLFGRGGLRRLLGLWLGLSPQAVPLEADAHGKPHCPGGPAFNISHSGELILLGLHASRPVGVDVERLRPALDWRAVARRMLPAVEQQALEALPETERAEAFLAAWCRLEARLKARGDGLAGLERLREQEQQADSTEPGGTASPDVSPAEDRRSEGSTTTGDRLWDVAVPAGYRAAVALATLAAP